mgnify:CR=1 FL=1
MDRAYTGHHEILLPDIEIKENRAEYIYVPLRGYSHTMAVFTANLDCPIGWINSETLGCSSVPAWMALTKWVDQGY